MTQPSQGGDAEPVNGAWSDGDAEWTDQTQGWDEGEDRWVDGDLESGADTADDATPDAR